MACAPGGAAHACRPSTRAPEAERQGRRQALAASGRALGREGERAYRGLLCEVVALAYELRVAPRRVQVLYRQHRRKQPPHLNALLQRVEVRAVKAPRVRGVFVHGEDPARDGVEVPAKLAVPRLLVRRRFRHEGLTPLGHGRDQTKLAAATLTSLSSSLESEVNSPTHLPVAAALTMAPRPFYYATLLLAAPAHGEIQAHRGSNETR